MRVYRLCRAQYPPWDGEGGSPVGRPRSAASSGANLHRGDKPRIVYLDANDIMGGNELPPRAVHHRGIR